MPFVAQLVGLWQSPELHTQWDGQYLVDYTPGEGVGADYIIQASTDIDRARRFESEDDVEATRYATDPSAAWRQQWHENTPNNELWRYTLRAVSVAS